MQERGRAEYHIQRNRDLFSHASRLKSQQIIGNFERNLEYNSVRGNDVCLYSSEEFPAYGNGHSHFRYRWRTIYTWHEKHSRSVWSEPWET